MAEPLPDQFGLNVLQKYGSTVTGGSTVSAGAGFNASAYTGGGFTPQPGTPTSPVYLGPSAKGAKPPVGPYAPGYRAPYTGADATSYEQATLLPTTWSENQKRDFISKGILYKIPGFGANMGMPELMDAWGNLVDRAQALSKSGTDWSPYDVMNSYANDSKNFGTVKSADGDWLLDAGTGERIKYIGPRSKTTTEKRIDLSSAEDVQALTTQMLTELLGRAPTAKELGQYKSTISGFERENPSLATTTQTINERGEVVGTSTKTTGGVSDAARQTLIAEQAKQGPEFGKYQSATTYFNAMMQMLGG